MAPEPDDHRWKVALRAAGPSDHARALLGTAGIRGLSWYRRGPQLMVTVTVDATSEADAGRAAMELVRQTGVRASVERARPLAG